MAYIDDVNLITTARFYQVKSDLVHKNSYTFETSQTVFIGDGTINADIRHIITLIFVDKYKFFHVNVPCLFVNQQLIKGQ